MKSKHFITKAEYPGGSEALKKFIKKNLRYPKEALMHRVEGSVFLRYEVNEKGKVNTKFKLTVHFKLPPVTPIKINYIYTKKSN